jgi:hypothetical protein
MSKTLDIIDIRRIAAANRVSEGRVIRAMAELHLVEHRINGRSFCNADDEDRIRQHLAEGKPQ